MMNLQLILKDGSHYKGESFGYWPKKEAFFVDGEVVFNTGMVGYPESLTDPSYSGQILVLTYPLVGNYGVPSESIQAQLSDHLESGKIHIQALIVSEYCQEHSHWKAEKSLADFLKHHK
ncbi:carbamoyl-phosphate synthase (glutamine-hydrolyzing) small subunit, partial [Candidatus Peregrinibacteria bacterium CG_4_10_14_0_2_um_filter_43_11]